MYVAQFQKWPLLLHSSLGKKSASGAVGEGKSSYCASKTKFCCFTDEKHLNCTSRSIHPQLLTTLGNEPLIPSFGGVWQLTSLCCSHITGNVWYWAPVLLTHSSTFSREASGVLHPSCLCAWLKVLLEAPILCASSPHVLSFVLSTLPCVHTPFPSSCFAALAVSVVRKYWWPWFLVPAILNLS